MNFALQGATQGTEICTNVLQQMMQSLQGWGVLLVENSLPDAVLQRSARLLHYGLATPATLSYPTRTPTVVTAPKGWPALSHLDQMGKVIFVVRQRDYAHFLRQVGPWRIRILKAFPFGEDMDLRVWTL